MPYQLVLSEPADDKTTKDVGENVFLDNLPSEFKVYLLYYRGAMPNEELENRLRQLGREAGNNLFVNLGGLNDPNYGKIANKFAIKNRPAIVITGIDELASTNTEPATAYIRLDSKNLLNSPDSAMECVQKIFNLYIQGKISEAMKGGSQDQLVFRLKELASTALKGIKDFFANRDIVISLIEGTLTLKRTGEK